MMTTKRRAYIRGLAMQLKPIFQIGKNGLIDEQLKQLDNALEARELIKISVLSNSPDDDLNEMANKIAEYTNCEVIQVMGNKITLYRRNDEKPKIEPRIKA